MKRLLFLVLACFITTIGFADDGIGLSTNYAKKKKRSFKFDKNRLIVGGGLGGGSIPGGYSLSITPSIGYAFTDRLHAGVNLGYFYSQWKNPYGNLGSYEKYKNRVISTSLYARFFPIEMLFLQVRPEINFITTKYEEYFAMQDRTTNEKYTSQIPAILVGGGYAQRLGGNSYMMITVMTDVLRHPDSPYRNQRIIFGGGLALGLFGGR